jgi:hypothetical protein
LQSTPPSNNQRRHFKGAIGSLVAAALLLTITLFITLNRQYVLDVVHFWTYQPTTEVKQVVTRAMFNDLGTFTFYAARPDIETGSKFNSHCDRKEQSTAILGCYANDRIYLFEVADKRLDGITEVTAAHEMLHVVYARMSDEDRAKVNVLVEAEYRKLSNNPEFADRMAFYDRTEPGERDNELHSIIGTEIEKISPELETHYAKYFNSRSKLLELFNRYNTVFNQLDAEAKALGKKLDQLAASIEVDSAKYNSSITSLNEDIVDFNKRAAAGDFSSQAAFNSERQSLQRRVSSINDLRSSINAKIAQYESYRQQYNETVTQSHNLYKSIDSLEPAPSV